MKLIGITKKYQDKTILDNINLDIEEGKILVILGESGIGKTTLLNIIANLITFDGKIEEKSDKISYVFQSDRLIKNLTIEENLLLVNKNIDVYSELKKIGLEDTIKMLPKNLSGGMARRIALLRGLLFKSDILLLDEPFSNVDIKNKFMIMDYIKEDSRKNNRTVIAVTHDIKEAVYLADRIILLNNGTIIYQNDKINKNTEDEIYNLLKNG